MYLSGALSSVFPLSTEVKRAPAKPQDGESLRFQTVGIWTIMQDTKLPWKIPGLSGRTLVSEFLPVFPHVRRFLLDCISVGPRLVSIYFFTTLWLSMGSAIGLYFSSRILDTIQSIIVNHQANAQSLVITVLSHLAFSCFNCVMERISLRTREKLASRVRYLFEGRLMQANLRLDVPTYEDPIPVSNLNKLLSHEGAWHIFEDLVTKFEAIASVVSQAGFLIGFLRYHPGGRWFAVLCFGKAILERLSHRSLWNEVSFVWDSNPHYRRVVSLTSIAKRSKARIEIVSNVLADYINREWSKARKLVGDLSDDYPDIILHVQKPLLVAFFHAISDDLPLMFYAYQVLLNPSSFSLTSIALMQQASTTLSYTIRNLVNTQHSLQKRFSEIKTLYESSDIPNKLLDGDLEYPRKDAEPASGMEISFENVSFAYPHSGDVIKDISFKIRQGQTIVIVGANGSGKSTLLKLFNRLYDPGSGSVTIDGVPMRSFKSADLRRASAMLFQQFSHYPLSIQENICLGRPDEEHYEDEKSGQDEGVIEAARLGGSLDLIKDQSNGFETVLQPEVRSYSTSSSPGSKGFQDKMSEINKTADLSLGQWQRLALSRLFFRAAADNIKLVAVDEPSASLDPKMEYELFESLRELSTEKGKTLVFVTHRFGYLTKRADLILVMQNGCLVEQGTHNELVLMEGEYAKLYKLQAEAFYPNDGVKLN